jgi:plasmid stabilization system protein ParE
MARPLNWAGRTVRDGFHNSYRIVYRVEPDAITVLTVFHAARLLDPAS